MFLKYLDITNENCLAYQKSTPINMKNNTKVITPPSRGNGLSGTKSTNIINVMGLRKININVCRGFHSLKYAKSIITEPKNRKR